MVWEYVAIGVFGLLMGWRLPALAAILFSAAVALWQLGTGLAGGGGLLDALLRAAGLVTVLQAAYLAGAGLCALWTKVWTACTSSTGTKNNGSEGHGSLQRSLGLLHPQAQRLAPGFKSHHKPHTLVGN